MAENNGATNSWRPFDQTITEGNLGMEPSFFTYSGEKEGARFSFAKKRMVKGELTTLWVNVASFTPHHVEFIREHFHKGTHVFVIGVQNFDTYEKDGETRVNLSIVADQVLLAPRGPKKATEGEDAPKSAKSAPKKAAPKKAAPNVEEEDEDDLPF
jgi:single-stranded DNA-binding protein